MQAYKQYQIKKMKGLDEKMLEYVSAMFSEEWGEDTEYWKDIISYIDEAIKKHGGEDVVALLGNKPIGYVSAHKTPYRDGDNFVYLDYLITDKNYRRNGIASKLIEEVKSYAKENGAKYVVMDTDSNKVFDFNVKHGIRVVEDFVLILPDAPLSYLMIYTIDENQKYISGKELKEIVEASINTMYAEEELNDPKYREFFDATLSQVDEDMNYVLSDNKFIPDNTYDKKIRDSQLPHRDLEEAKREAQRIRNRFNRIFYL